MRRVRLLLFALFVPVLVTGAFGFAYFGLLGLMGHQYSRDAITTALAVFFACWQVWALIWLWGNWRAGE